MNADTLDTMLEFVRRGYSFTTMGDALNDPAYQIKVDPSGKFGPSWLNRWARAQHKKMTAYGQPDPAGWIEDQHKLLCRTR